eukprot:7386407-Prymnesium_polylepis.1
MLGCTTLGQALKPDPRIAQPPWSTQHARPRVTSRKQHTHASCTRTRHGRAGGRLPHRGSCPTRHVR